MKKNIFNEFFSYCGSQKTYRTNKSNQNQANIHWFHKYWEILMEKNFKMKEFNLCFFTACLQEKIILKIND